MAFLPGQPGLAGTRKVNHFGFHWSKRWWGGSGISWTICKSFAPHSGQITTTVPHHSAFTGRMPLLPPNQQHQSTEGTLILRQKRWKSSSQCNSVCSVLKRKTDFECWRFSSCLPPLQSVCLCVCARWLDDGHSSNAVEQLSALSITEPRTVMVRSVLYYGCPM